MLVGKIFKLFRKLTENNNRMSTGTYIPPSNSITPPPSNNTEIGVNWPLTYNKETGEWSFNNTKYSFPMANIDGHVGIGSTLPSETKHTTILYHITEDNTLVIDTPHTVDIEYKKLINIEDKGPIRRYYGKGETRINFIKDPKNIEKDKDRVIRLQNKKVLAEEEHERLLNKMDEWPEEPKIIK